ncbi:MAG: glycosyltransferase family 4 protein, partial [Bacteroidetes bacterium]|nr:glycosyltransferase family 4 protein [Bacteroidota bacterium]
PDRQWDIDLYIQGKIQPLTANKKLLYNDFNTEDTIKKDKQGIKVKKSLFQRFEGTLVNIIPDNFIAYLNKHNIRIFHKVYDIIKQTLFKVAELIVKAVRFIINLLYLIKTWLKHLFTDPKTEKQFRTYDLIHLPLMQHYPPFRRTKSRILVTVHDLTHRYYPKFHTPINISNAEKGLRFITRSEADVIAVSDSTFRDTLKECRINKEKVHLVYEAAEKDKFRFILNRDETGKVKKKYGIPLDGPFFLCLSTIEPRKNLTNTIRAFTKLIEENKDYNVNLVIAGKKGWSFDKLYLHNKVLSKRIVFTGFVDDKDLSALYSETLALCYISFYEGFGLPILEAMNCMSPVIYGDNSSMPEIVGDGGLPADPENIDDIKQKMKQIFENRKLRKQIRKMALKKSLKFSWRNTIIDTLKVYDQIINHS